MATLGKPSITTPRSADREIQSAIDNIRERFMALEDEAAALRLLAEGNSTTKAITLLKQQLNSQAEAAANPDGTAALALLNALLALANGLVVVRNGVLTTRTLQAGPGIFITYPDGYSGNPIISLIPPADVLPLALGSNDGHDWWSDTDQDAPTEYIEPLLGADAPAALAYTDIDAYNWWVDVDLDQIMLFIDQTPIPSAPQSFSPGFDDGFDWGEAHDGAMEF